MLPPQCKGRLAPVHLHFVLKHQLKNSGSSWVFMHVYVLAVGPVQVVWLYWSWWLSSKRCGLGQIRSELGISRVWEV